MCCRIVKETHSNREAHTTGFYQNPHKYQETPTDSAWNTTPSATMESVPPELLIMIMEAMPDLASLYSLICASPCAEAIFNRNPSRYINQIIQDTLPYELRPYPRWIAVIGSLRSDASPYSTPNQTPTSFISRYREFQNHCDLLYAFPELDEAEPLVRQLSGTPGPRTVLVAAHRIEKLENICLASMLARLHEVEPGRPRGGDGPEQPRPENLILELEELCGPHALWGPSWVERIRVREALWQIMTSCYSRMVPGIPAEGVSRENREEWCAILGTMDPMDRDAIAGAWNRGYQRGDPFDCVYYTLWDVLGCSPMRLFTGLANKDEVRYAQDQVREVLSESLGFVVDWDDAEPQPVEAVYCGGGSHPLVADDDADSTVQAQSDATDDDGDVDMQEVQSDITDNDGDVGMQPADNQDAEPQPSDAVERDEGDVFGQSRRHIRCANYGTWFFVLNYCGSETSGPVHRQHLLPISRLGLSVWDTRRLLTLGLAQLPDGGYPDHEAREADLEVRREVWRRVFVREYNRMRGTPFKNEVTTPRLRRDIDIWVTWGNDEGWMWRTAHVLSNGRDIRSRYDGPVEEVGQIGTYDDVVWRMRREMRAEKGAYEGEGPPFEDGDGDSGDEEDENVEDEWEEETEGTELSDSTTDE